MDAVIFMAFLFFSLISLGYAFYNKKVIYLAALNSFFLFILAASLMTEGLSNTYVGVYGFYNNSSSVTGAITTTAIILTNTNVFAQGMGMFLFILGIMTLFLTFWYMLKGSEEAEE